MKVTRGYVFVVDGIGFVCFTGRGARQLVLDCSHSVVTLSSFLPRQGILRVYQSTPALIQAPARKLLLCDGKWCPCRPFFFLGTFVITRTMYCLSRGGDVQYTKEIYLRCPLHVLLHEKKLAPCNTPDHVCTRPLRRKRTDADIED